MTTTKMEPPVDALDAYAPQDGFYDEAVAPGGAVREPYAELWRSLDLEALRRAQAGIARHLDDRGVRFGAGDEGYPVQLDAIPRILTASEWTEIERGVAQRVRALNAFCADAYGPRRIVADGVLPARVIETADNFDPAMRWVDPPHHLFTHVAGLDIVRDAEGTFRCLEDNLRTPSGARYAAAARAAVAEHLPLEPPAPDVMDDALVELEATIHACSPRGRGEANAVVLSDGPSNSAWFEHHDLARRLGLPLVRAEDLDVRGLRLRAWIDGSPRPVDVIYRRTDEDRLSLPDYSLTHLGELLIGPVLAGRLAVINAFGTGMADDKLVHVYADELIRYYLDEQPRMPSVPGYDLAEREQLAEALERFDELVVKPRGGYGGEGVVVCSQTGREARDEVRERIVRNPERYVAQIEVPLSTHPTLTEDGLEPRHVDLRPFAIATPGGVKVAVGGLTRFAGQRGSLVVNSSQGGGAKDTWVK